jgi:hypothetical protein
MHYSRYLYEGRRYINLLVNYGLPADDPLFESVWEKPRRKALEHCSRCSCPL